MLDRLSDLLCKVIDLAEFIRTAHPEPAWAQAADEAHQHLCNYMNVLNTDTGLYNSLKIACERKDVWDSFSEEEQKVAEVFLNDFEKSAIHLPEQQRRSFVALQDEILYLSSAFSQHLHAAEDREPATIPLSWLRDCPDALQGRLRNDAGISADANSVRIPAAHPVLFELLRHAPDRRAREAAYRSAFASGATQTQLLDLLITRRAELAKLTGFKSFAHMTLKDKLAGSPDVVSRFLASQLRNMRSNLDAEQQHLLQQVRSPARALAPWDREFAMQSHFDRMHGTPISPFLSVGTVFSGISALIEHLFGLRLVLSSADQGELWCDDVLKFEVFDEDEGGFVGNIYADLWSRPGKPSGAAHFTLRCSRRVDWDVLTDDQTRSEQDILSGPRTTYRTRDGEFQRPVVALLCDFRRSSSFGPPLLAWAEVETLLHEIGHAVHSMMGRTDFQNVSGTRCATDFVEVPSILMEQFLLDPAGLALLARHHRTGAPLNLRQLRPHLGASFHFPAMEQHDELMLASLDQALHGVGFDGEQLDSTAIMRAHHRKYSILEPALDVAWQARVAHLATYPAAYYAYPLDRALARALWSDLFSCNSRRDSSGRYLKTEVLAKGGGVSPIELLQQTAVETNAHARQPSAVARIASTISAS